MDKRILTQEFPKELIKKRKGKRGMVYPYVKTEDVLKRLFEATDSYSIKVKEHFIHNNEAIVLVTLDLDGQIIESFGNAVVNDSAGDALKAAESDSIRKAAAMAGVPAIFHVSENTEQETEEVTDTEQFSCSDCGVSISKQIHTYSNRNLGKSLCMRCQQKHRQVASR